MERPHRCVGAAGDAVTEKRGNRTKKGWPPFGASPGRTWLRRFDRSELARKCDGENRLAATILLKNRFELYERRDATLIDVSPAVAVELFVVPVAEPETEA